MEIVIAIKFTESQRWNEAGSDSSSFLIILNDTPAGVSKYRLFTSTYSNYRMGKGNHNVVSRLSL